MNDRMVNMVGAFATALSDRVADAIAASSELGQTAAEGLITICNHPGEPVEALAARLALTPAGATRLLDRLERKHLVRRTVAAGDKRLRRVQPTPQGRRLAFEMFRARRSVMSMCWSRSHQPSRLNSATCWSACLRHSAIVAFRLSTPAGCARNRPAMQVAAWRHGLERTARNNPLLAAGKQRGAAPDCQRT